MKNPRFFFVFLSIVFSFSVSATEILSRKISIILPEMLLKNALDEVAKTANFECSYNPNILEKRPKVRLSVQNWTVREVLLAVLGDDFEFKTSGNYLIIKKQKTTKNELSGILRDPKTGERVANATVFDRRTLRATTTDSSGFYKIKVKKSSEIVVAKLGFRDTIFTVTSSSPRFQKIEISRAPTLPKPATDPRFSKKIIRKSTSELESFFAATVNKYHDLNVPDTLRRRFQLSIFPKIGTNHVLDGKVENNISINIVAGQSAGVRKLELGGLGNFTRKKMRGAQFGGAFNVVKGRVSGLQMAGFFNLAGDTLNGAQFAGFANMAKYSHKFGFQAAGFGNILKNNHSTGVQLAGCFNLADEINGLQMAGLFNHAKKIRGLQIGIFNSKKSKSGFQIGILNRSGRRVLPIFNW
jgi:hypothetical protein